MLKKVVLLLVETNLKLLNGSVYHFIYRFHVETVDLAFSFTISVYESRESSSQRFKRWE